MTLVWQDTQKNQKQVPRRPAKAAGLARNDRFLAGGGNGQTQTETHMLTTLSGETKIECRFFGATLGGPQNDKFACWRAAERPAPCRCKVNERGTKPGR